MSMIDWSTLLHSTAGNLFANKVQDGIDQTKSNNSQPDPFVHSGEDYIKDIHHVLVSLAAFLQDQSTRQQDIYRYVTLYKAGLGAPYRPLHNRSRSHFQIFSPVAVTLNVMDSGLGAFNLTLVAATWTSIDFPEGTRYQIDTGYANASLVIYERETSADVI